MQKMKKRIRFITHIVFVLLLGSAASAQTLPQAVKAGNLAEVRNLISAGADVNEATGQHNLTPLHTASGMGYWHIVKFLLDNDANKDAVAKVGTPLHVAASTGHISVVRLLLDYGADPAPKINNVTPRDLAEKKELYEIESLLRKRIRRAERKTWKKKPRTSTDGVMGQIRQAIEKGNEAANAGNYQAMLLAIKKGAKANPNNEKEGLTPLHIAAQWNLPQVAELMLKNGVNVNILDNNGATPLHQALRSGCKQVVYTLLKYGADIKAKDQWSWTPLHCSAMWDWPDITELLIMKGADVKAVETQRGFTPMHVAAYRYALMNIDGDVTTVAGYDYVAYMLIKGGANVNAKDKYGYLPLYYANYDNKKDIAKMLLKYGAVEKLK